MANQERDFKGVWIDKIIWLDTELNALDKVILVEVDSLDQSDRGCYASNKHLAEFCQCSESKVSKSISKLVNLGYLYVKSFDGRQREIKSRLSERGVQPRKKNKAASQKVLESNIDSNTVSNTESIDILAKPKNKKFVPPTLEECIAAFKEKGSTETEANNFYDHYTMNGWVQGRGKPIKSWTAAVSFWIRNSHKYNNGYNNTKKGGKQDAKYPEPSAELLEKNGYGFYG